MGEKDAVVTLLPTSLCFLRGKFRDLGGPMKETFKVWEAENLNLIFSHLENHLWDHVHLSKPDTEA